MKKIVVLVLMCLLGASLVPVALATIEATYTVMPYSGPFDQKINIYLRCQPLTDTDIKTVYLFWNRVQIGAKLTSTKIGTTANYQHLWDISFTPPVGDNFEGTNSIEIWIENAAGERVVKYWSYTITDGGAPPVDAWARYIAEHPEILAQLRGPVGPVGPAGAPGVGVRGVKGEDGAPAIIDYAQLWATIPPEMMLSLKGEQGIQGVQGESASPVVIGIGCVVSIVASAVFTWFYAQRKEVSG